MGYSSESYLEAPSAPEGAVDGDVGLVSLEEATPIGFVSVAGFGDVGAKSSSNPSLSLSESESSSRSSSEMGGNSEAKAAAVGSFPSAPPVDKDGMSNAEAPAAAGFVCAFLKLAKADSKSSLALA